MKKLVFLFSIIIFSFVGCQTDDKVEIGKKTEMKVNSVFDAGNVNKGEKNQGNF